MQPIRDLVGLALSTNGGGVGGQVAGSGDENMGSFGVALQQFVLVEGGFDSLDSMEVAVFT